MIRCGQIYIVLQAECGAGARYVFAWKKESVVVVFFGRRLERVVVVF